MFLALGYICMIPKAVVDRDTAPNRVTSRPHVVVHGSSFDAFSKVFWKRIPYDYGVFVVGQIDQSHAWPLLLDACIARSLVVAIRLLEQADGLLQASTEQYVSDATCRMRG
jgi:hypothetical protein